MEIFKDERILNLIKILAKSIEHTHFENHVFLTGGAIRNSILCMPITDVDIVVDMNNGGILLASYLAMKHQCFTANKNPVVYDTYGTAKLQLLKNDDLKDIEIECVDTRKYRNVFGTLQEDAKRRDLTINALMYNVSKGTLMDFNGTAIDDMAHQILRTPSDPNVILKEDPIKILRIIRFSTVLGWGIEKNTWLAMIENAPLIKGVAQEKISNEIAKILLCDKPSVGICKMYYCGILHRVMPDIYDTTYAYESKNPMVTTFEHTMKVLDEVQPYIENRLAALFHDVGRIITDKRRDINADNFSGEVAAADLKMMKFPNYVIKSVQTAIEHHRAFSIYADGVLPSDKKIRKFVNTVGDDVGTTIDLMNANNLHCTYGKKKRQVLDIVNRIEELEKEEEIANIKLPINGSDIQKEFRLKASPLIGILIAAVKDAYFENPNLTKDEAFGVVEAKLKSMP